ncbi:MAG: MBL fold metallo-hydrolase [Myxococcales bacterium]|nr:MBL fold metallo-hydrolase [Myxococcales bacterium]
MSERLSDDIRLHLTYEDRTPFGSQTSQRFDRELRARCETLMEAIRSRGLCWAVQNGPALLSNALSSRDMQVLFQGPNRLRDEVLFPAQELCQPRALVVEQAGGPVPIALSTGLVGELACWLGDWQRGAPAPRHGAARALHRALRDAGAIVDDPVPTAEALEPVTFLGHAGVRISHGDTTALVDPFVLPSHPEDPPGLVPLQIGQLGPVHGVLITHSHPDHFDLGTLLRLGADTTIMVPEVERESLLATDMAARLRELGFRRVQTLAWWQAATLGSLTVHALPFFGEQPTDGEVLHPEVRNLGNTYQVVLGDRSVALTVDSGTDRLGTPKAVARRARKMIGAPDLLLGGHRGFGMYPVQYAMSSVARYLLFVPPDQWGARQQIMCDSQGLVDVAESWGAATVAPYAAGGAPCFWRMGLGPALDGSRPLQMAVDPPPEAVVQATVQRSGSLSHGDVASPVRPLILRPGEGVVLAGSDTAPVARSEWPYPPITALQSDYSAVPRYCDRYAHEDWSERNNEETTPGGDSVAWLKKKALLGILAREHARLLGVFPSPSAVRATSDNFRKRFGLSRVADTRRFFDEQGLDTTTWSEMMTDICAIDTVEAVLSGAVLARVPAVARVWNARARGRVR